MLTLLRNIIFLAGIFPAAALAGDSDVRLSDGPEGSDPSVWCERILSASERQTHELEIAKRFFDRPYVVDIFHEMTPAGLAKMKLGTLGEEKLSKLVLIPQKILNQHFTASIHLFEGTRFNEVTTYDFDRRDLVAWDWPNLKEQDQNLSYEELLRKFPPSEDNRSLGWRSAPDKDGVRLFIRFAEGRPLEPDRATIGLQVPCDQVETYTHDVVEMIDDVRTPEGLLCQIAVLFLIGGEN